MKILFGNINESINSKIFLWLCLLPPNPLALLQYETNLTLQQPLLGFFPYALLLSQSLINADNFLSLWYKAPIFKIKCSLTWSTEIPKYDSKKEYGSLCSWKFFFQSREMKVSGYTGVWYVLFNFAVID